jgi:uncharacterized protein YqgC (DUF456 family)
MTLLTVLAVLVMVIALFTTPLGAPGNWIMVAVLAAGVWFERVGWLVLIASVLVAGAAEVMEFLLVRRLSLQYGGSRRAFWGSIAGGIVGVVVGAPVPLIGSIVAGFLGSFIGAALVTIGESRNLDHAGRVGWGVLLGRVWAAGVKTGAGVIILVLGAAAFLL